MKIRNAKVFERMDASAVYMCVCFKYDVKEVYFVDRVV